MTMPRTVHILRHAHSSWARPGQRDHQRPLDERGHAEARRLATSIEAHGISIGHVVCSTATRASETLQAILPALSSVTTVEMSDALYAFGPEAYRSAILHHRAPGDLLLVGHNPSIETLVFALCANGDEAAFRSIRGGFGTACWAIVDLPESSCEDGSGHLRAVLRP